MSISKYKVNLVVKSHHNNNTRVISYSSLEFDSSTATRDVLRIARNYGELYLGHTNFSIEKIECLKNEEE